MGKGGRPEATGYAKRLHVHVTKLKERNDSFCFSYLLASSSVDAAAAVSSFCAFALVQCSYVENN